MKRYDHCYYHIWRKSPSLAGILEMFECNGVKYALSTYREGGKYALDCRVLTSCLLEALRD